MSEPLVFVLPLPVNLANARFGHWSKRYKCKKDYWGALDAALILKRLPRPPRTPYAKATLDAAIYHTHDTDNDNREARLKDAVDWLKTRGYIVDDSAAHLERVGLVRDIRVHTVTDRKLVLTLTPVAA